MDGKARSPGEIHNKIINPNSYHVLSLILFALPSNLDSGHFLKIKDVLPSLVILIATFYTKICVNSILKQQGNYGIE